MNLLEASVQSLVVGVISGVVSGYLVSEWLRRSWRPRMASDPEIVRVPSVILDQHMSGNDQPIGDLYKIKFRLAGKQSPEFCALEIEWKTTTGTPMRVFGKWDETAMPIASHERGSFRPELVPQTYFQPILLDRDYLIPVLLVTKGDAPFQVFSGWWFGIEQGYKTGAKEISRGTELRLRLAGATDVYWEKAVRVGDFVDNAEDIDETARRFTADGKW